jgi:D-alanyl-D-alanine carboxypeptidase
LFNLLVAATLTTVPLSTSGQAQLSSRPQPSCALPRTIIAEPLPGNAVPPPAHFSRFGDSPVSTKRALALDRRLGSFASASRIVSVAIAYPDGTTWSGTTGTRGDARFHAASVVKSFSAVIARQLIAEGKLSSTDTVDRWYPAVPNASLITIADLLQHTSGLATPTRTEAIDTYEPVEVKIARLTAKDVVACPGQTWAYSNIGYIILGGIIERVERKSFAEVLARRVARPLKLAVTYVPKPGDLAATVLPGFNKGVPVGPSDYAGPHAAGSLVSNPVDLIRFWRGVLGAKVVSSAGRDAMLGRFIAWNGNARLAYGQGAMAFIRPGTGGAMFGHSGSIVGFNSLLLYAPREDVFIAVMTNDRAQSADDVAGAFLDNFAADR